MEKLPVIRVIWPWYHDRDAYMQRSVEWQNGGKVGDAPSYYEEPFEIEVEVLTVHFNKNTMRVRPVDKKYGNFYDFSATAFFEQMQVVPK